MSKLESKLASWVVVLGGLSLGGMLACGDEEGGDGPAVCHETVDACADCTAGLNCGALAAGGYECYTPCDTADDCSDCDMEKVCGYGEGDRMLCVTMP